jgi:hypothetical protein
MSCCPFSTVQGIELAALNCAPVDSGAVTAARSAHATAIITATNPIIVRDMVPPLSWGVRKAL